MSLRRRITLACGVLILTSGCGGGVAESQSRAQPLVYGSDDRRDVYEVTPDDALAALARGSLLALGRASEVQVTQPERAGEALVRVTSPSVQERLGLCPDERFGTQPAFALCSSFPIAPHLALTADHCLDVLPAEELALLSGFYETAPGVLAPIAAAQVHPIDEVVARDPLRDVALLRVGGLALSALPLARELPPPGEALSSVNHGMGVPAKIVSGARAFFPNGHSFVTDLDAFGGASGAAVFDHTYAVVGLLTSGLPDYEQTEAGCFTARREADGSFVANELVEHAYSALEALCAQRFVPEVCDETSPPAPSCSLALAPRNGESARWTVALGLALTVSLLARRRRQRRPPTPSRTSPPPTRTLSRRRAR